MAELDSAIQGPPAANTVLDRRVKPGDDSPAMPRRVGELLDSPTRNEGHDIKEGW
jgi:hypothetical protein